MEPLIQPSPGSDEAAATPDPMALTAKHAAEFLKAIAHESRSMMMCILAQGERSVSELERMLALRQPTVSQQLARLRADGLVTTRRDGKTIYYRVASPEAAHRARRGLRGVSRRRRAGLIAPAPAPSRPTNKPPRPAARCRHG